MTTAMIALSAVRWLSLMGRLPKQTYSRQDDCLHGTCDASRMGPVQL